VPTAPNPMGCARLRAQSPQWRPTLSKKSSFAGRLAPGSQSEQSAFSVTDPLEESRQMQARDQ
jgi:hypothetical protein